MASEPLLILILAVTLSASPIAPPLPEPGLQHWYTVSIPQETGVYELEVYAPALPALFAQPQIVVLGEPLRLMETPEPGTTEAVLFALVFIFGIGWVRSSNHGEEARESLQTRNSALLAILATCKDEDCKEIARKALEE